jgi:N-acetylmuramoyl-L-alanine amidase
MKLKKLAVLFNSIVLSTMLFAANDISLMEKCKNSGMTIYWDSLSESGMIEKNGHQLSFRNGEAIVLLDSIRMMITDAPELRDNQLYVSKKFLDRCRKYIIMAILILDGDYPQLSEYLKFIRKEGTA